ncbi:MAG: biopolymer transporter ExbD [Leptolyngbya sp. PLA3]|nr:MAG: biopolymer transporter ExbD [Cyanobacteria bacterium CYA]MCE7968940.1 biopolymer transporter ExbD [Leptolyngbya sp. PL-A3]
MIRFRRTSPEVRLEMTPMIDVIFLLLTFFIFALVLMVRADVLDVKLPQIGAGQEPSGELITIAIEQDGRVAVDGQAVELGELVERVKALRSERPEARLVIAVDREGRLGVFIQVADTLAGAGLGEFGIIGTQAEEDGLEPEKEP